MSTWGSEGIVIKRADWGEADKLLTIFTRSRGKVRAVAKGVRKIKSRRAAGLELLNHSKLFFSENKNFNTLTEAEILTDWRFLKSDLKKISYSYRLAEIVDHLFQGEAQSISSFELIVDTLKNIDSSSSLAEARLFSRAFEIKLLTLAGFRPQLDACVKCGEALKEQTNFLAPDLGGIVGRECGSSLVLGLEISPAAIKTLRFLASEDWDQIKKLAVNPRLEKEIERHLVSYLEYVLEKTLRSSRFIAQVESL